MCRELDSIHKFMLIGNVSRFLRVGVGHESKSDKILTRRATRFEVRRPRTTAEDRMSPMRLHWIRAQAPPRELLGIESRSTSFYVTGRMIGIRLPASGAQQAQQAQLACADFGRGIVFSGVRIDPRQNATGKVLMNRQMKRPERGTARPK